MNLINLLKKDFNIDRDSILDEEQKKKINELIGKSSFEFRNLEKRINPDNLIYKYKTEGRSPKDFRNYQNLADLFKNLRDDNINPQEVLKNQNNLNSSLGKIKKGNLNLESEDESSVT